MKTIIPALILLSTFAAACDHVDPETDVRAEPVDCTNEIPEDWCPARLGIPGQLPKSVTLPGQKDEDPEDLGCACVIAGSGANYFAVCDDDAPGGCVSCCAAAGGIAIEDCLMNDRCC